MSRGGQCVKLVEWSGEDGGGMVESSTQVYEREGRSLPESLSRRDFVNALQRIA